MKISKKSKEHIATKVVEFFEPMNVKFHLERAKILSRKQKIYDEFKKDYKAIRDNFIKDFMLLVRKHKFKWTDTIDCRYTVDVLVRAMTTHGYFVELGNDIFKNTNICSHAAWNKKLANTQRSITSVQDWIKQTINKVTFEIEVNNNKDNLDSLIEKIAKEIMEKDKKEYEEK